MVSESESQLAEEARLSLEETGRQLQFMGCFAMVNIFAIGMLFMLAWLLEGALATWVWENKYFLLGLLIPLAAFLAISIRQRELSRRKYRSLLEEIKKVETALEKGSDSERRAHREREEEKKAEREFKKNLKSEIVLRNFSLRGLDFYHPIDWELQPQVNVLLGKNGYGKSHLLRGLAAMVQADGDVCNEFFEHGNDDVVAILGLTRDGEPKTVVRQRLFFGTSISKVPLLAIPDTRFLNKSRSTIGSGTDDKVDPARHGAHHFLNEKPYEAVIENFLYQMCLDFVRKRRRFRLAIFELIREVVRELTDESFDFHEIQQPGQGKFLIQVLTEGNEDFPLPIQKASQGTLSVLAIFSLIYNFLRSVHEKVPERDILEQTGIVIIDEIDAHLHPSWQQKILGLLRRKFPNVQFLVTAHSPLVVAGCLAGEVAVLRKREGRFAVEQIERDFVGAESASLYRELFEVEELDESFLYYLTQERLGEDYEEEINKLEKKEELSPEEERQLARLHRLSRYTIRAAEVKEERDSRDYESLVGDLKAQIRDLERQLEIATTTTTEETTDG